MAVGVGVVLFLLTSFSDPGTVTAKNVYQYISVYPYDNVIFSERECSTCKILKWVIPPYLLDVFFGACVDCKLTRSLAGLDLQDPSTALCVIAV